MFKSSKWLRTTLERLSCHKDFKITQAQTKVSFFYLNPLLQVEFRAIFEPFSYILLNGSNITQYCHVCKSQTTSGPPVKYPVFKSLTTLGDRSFTCAAPKLWNSLPKAIRCANNVNIFKCLLKTHLFRDAFSCYEKQ